MIISWKNSPDKKPIETEKAFGFKIKHNDSEKVMWIPKSVIKNKYTKGTTMADIPDWLYDKKIDELFLGDSFNDLRIQQEKEHEFDNGLDCIHEDWGNRD